jgi:threonine dehydrogenase-like Zn-dependent dehydrogenase
MQTMKAAVFKGPGRIVLDEKPVPKAGPGEALVKITTTTICGTDIHILTGKYPVEPGRIIGHEPVGVIAELGQGVTGFQPGQRVIVGAITPWAGLADETIVTTLCPGGRERMRRLINVVGSGRANLEQLVTHRFKLDQIEQAYDMFAAQRDGVLKVAITP